jgi:type III secretion protein J
MYRHWLWILGVLVGCSARIQHGLDERQANELQAVLIERGIEAKKLPEGGKKPSWALEVDEAREADAVRVLADLGLPKVRNEGFDDVFGKGSLVPSPLEERALYLEALSGELSRTLESVDGVVSARVHLVLPEAQRGLPVQGGAKASALLRVRAAQMDRLAQERQELKALVAGGVEGLSADNVALVFNEVTTHVEERNDVRTRLERLHELAVTLGAVVSLLGGAVVVLAYSRRRLRNQLAAARAPSSSGRGTGTGSTSGTHGPSQGASPASGHAPIRRAA